MRAAFVLGILAAVFSLPTAVCNGACAAVVAGGKSQEEQAAAAGINMGVAILVGVFSLVSALVVRTRAKPGGVMLLIAAVISCGTSFNPMSWINGLLLLIAGLVALSYKPTTAPPA